MKVPSTERLTELKSQQQYLREKLYTLYKTQKEVNQNIENIRTEMKPLHIEIREIEIAQCSGHEMESDDNSCEEYRYGGDHVCIHCPYRSYMEE